MASLRIQLFQSLALHAGDEPPLDLGSPTARSLLAYLILNRNTVVDRRRLAYIFWDRESEQAARRNLRQYLHRLRRHLEPLDPDGRLLLSEGNWLRFALPADASLDVAAFEAAATPPHEDLRLAISLYAGDLLEDVYDDWVLPERERLARLFRDCLLQLVEQAEAAGQFDAAISYAERYVAAEPLVEGAHVRLMHLYYALGDRARVQQAYQRLATRLHEDLNARPLPETTTLLEKMLAGEYGPPALPRAPSPDTDGHRYPVKPPVRPDVGKRPGRAPGPFVGRSAELDWLDRAWQEAIGGRGRLCYVHGELGVGKTRLADEFLARLGSAALVFYGRGHEFESMIPYGPLVNAFGEAGGTRIPWERLQPPPRWLPALLPLLPDLPARYPDLALDDLVPATRYHVVEALGHLLLTLARQRPVVLVLDNLHWADLPTWRFLGYMAQRVGASRLLLIGVARGEDMPPERARLVRRLERQHLMAARRLERLSQEETFALVRELMSDRLLDPRFARRIYEETEGNPFFIVETTRAVREAGGDWTRSVPTDEQGHRPFFAIPLQVQAVIESRLDKLSEDSRAALGVAATIGREFTFALLSEVSQLPTETLLNALDEWLARGLVRETGRGYDFTHEKLSQVAYQQLSRARRQWIHFQVAEFLAANRADADPAQLAHHFYRSTAPDRALPYLALAGQRALSVRSYAEAREFGLQAIGLLGRFGNLTRMASSERIDLNLQLAQAYGYTGALPRALELLQETERLAEAAGDLERLGWIFHRSAQIFWLRGQPGTADDYARRTMRQAEELDHAPLRFAALRMLGRAGIALSRYDDAIAYLLRYIDLATGPPGTVDLPAVYGYLGVAYARVGSWQRAIDAAQQGLELADAELAGAIHVVARMQLAFVYAELQEWEQALAVAAPARDLWREEGMTPHAFMLRSVIARCLAHTGLPADSVAELQAALRWAEEVDYRVLVHVVTLYLAQAQYQSDQLDACIGTAGQAAELAARAGNRWAEAVARRVGAEAAMRLPRPDWPTIEAGLLQSLSLLRQVRARPDLARTYLALRRLYDRAGLSPWAVDCHIRATTIFAELGMGDELRDAQGTAAGERTGAVVLPGLTLRGPHAAEP